MGSNTLTKYKPKNDQYIIMDYKYCNVWIRKIDKI